VGPRGQYPAHTWVEIRSVQCTGQVGREEIQPSTGFSIYDFILILVSKFIFQVSIQNWF
jgi:hypothetical protein